MKLCTKCNTVKPINSFSKKGAGLNSYCKACHSEYVNIHYKKNKKKYLYRNKKNKEKIKAYIDSVKEKSKCTFCGENHIATLQFHHTTPNEKEFTIAEAVRLGKSLKTIKHELNKCIVLCANCHFKLHWELDRAE